MSRSAGSESPVSFNQRVNAAQRRSGSRLCVGIDPLVERIPGGAEALAGFCRRAVEATVDQVCAYKPQIAHFAALGAETVLVDLIGWIHEQVPDIPVILDAKRGDIGSTAECYAVEAYDRYDADAVTLSPYTGPEGMAPFLERTDRGVIVLCRTSNAGADWIQCYPAESPLFLRIAERAQQEWNRADNVLLVAGATHPEDIARIRQVAPDLGLLVPGVGAQGGDLREVLRAGLRADGLGVVINASRSIIYADGMSTREICAAACTLNQQVKEILG